MKYIAVDPSFSRTGVATLDTDNKEIVLKHVRPIGKNDTYKNTVERSAVIATGILEEIKVYETVQLLIEEPMVSSIKASSMGVLAGVVATTLLLLPNITNIYTVNPTTIRSLNSALPYKKELNKKQLSQRVALELIDFYESIGYTASIKATAYNKDGSVRKRAMTHDEAEALILLTVFLLSKDILTESEKLNVYKINKGFYTKKIKINKLK